MTKWNKSIAIPNDTKKSLLKTVHDSKKNRRSSHLFFYYLKFTR